MKKLNKFLCNDSGNISVLIAITFPVILICTSVAIDIASVSTTKKRLQDVADNAVLYGVLEINNKPASAAKNYFKNYAEDFSTVEANFDGSENIVSLTATAEIEHLFPFTENGGKTIVQVKSAATTGEASTPPCIYILDETDREAFSATISGRMKSTCGVQVNSNNRRAFDITYSGVYDVVETLVVGNVDLTGSGRLVVPPTPGAPTLSDPLSHIPEPASKSLGCDYNDTKVNSSRPVTLSPGVYCGGIKINASSTISFEPGQYVIRDGDLDLNVSGRATGSELLFVFEGDSVLDINSSGNINLSAKTSGTYKDILMFQHREGSEVEFSLNMSGNQKYEGAIYAPRAILDWSISGNYKSPQFMPLVIKKMDKLNLSGRIEFEIPHGKDIFKSKEASTARLVL